MKHWRASESWIPLSPMTFGDSMVGTTHLGTLTLWAGIKENSWHALTPLAHPMTAVFHRWICLVGQHLQLAP